MTRWPTGADKITDLLTAGSLEQVAPSNTNAERLVTEARSHLKSAEMLTTVDPPGAYDMLYSAARKSLAAVLARQGLRATSRGGHVAVEDAVTAQLGSQTGIVRPFGRLRRTRNDADYPRLDTPDITTEDILEDLPKAKAIVEAMEKLLPHLDAW